MADPKRLIKKSSTCPNEKIADQHAYSSSLQAHTPAGLRTRVDVFDANIERVAPRFPTRCTKEKTLLRTNLVDDTASSTSACEHQLYPAVSPPEISRTRNVPLMHTPLTHPSLSDCVAPMHKSPQGTSCDSIFGTECLNPTLPADIEFCPHILKILMEIIVVIGHITIVLIDISLPDDQNSDEDFCSDTVIHRRANRSWFFSDFTIF